ncbi:hypothetical protein QZH41_018649 [Actinostola sp. cb2023]|nr:hypothetical protein QZH41_018649 [Actinostola sp. cb2023]
MISLFIDFLEVYGPADWGHVSKDCDDRSQSPVNIDTSKVDIVGSGHVDRERVQFKELSSYAGGTLANNGHSLTFTVKEGGMTFKNPINGQNYELAQIHFHFGCDDSVGSEHTVDGKHYPGEMHLVLFNTKYGDIDTAATKPDGLTVIAVFLEKDNYKVIISGGRINVLTGFSMRAGKISNEGAEIPFGVRLANLVPGFVNGRLVYYSYQGSLTTPGCYQSVSWLVLFKPIKADGFVVSAMFLLCSFFWHTKNTTTTKLL